jgi:hypothetical protein
MYVASVRVQGYRLSLSRCQDEICKLEGIRMFIAGAQWKSEGPGWWELDACYQPVIRLRLLKWAEVGLCCVFPYNPIGVT